MSILDLGFTTVKQELPAFIHEGLARYAAQSNGYHHQPDELRRRIADKHHVDVESILLTAGADQAIFFLNTVFGKQTHTFTPTYVAYADARRLGGALVEHPSLKDEKFILSPGPIKDATLIFLANPNNPAGLTGREVILKLVQNNPDALVVIDEAYGDYAGESVIQDVAKHRNLVVIRSFSKGYALAGFRIAYIVAQKPVLDRLDFDSTWANVAYTSVGAAITALEHEEYFAAMRTSIIAERQKLERFLNEYGYTIVPSSINAALLRFDQEAQAQEFVSKLQGKDIRVNLGNGASNIGLDGHFVRISIGTPEQMLVLQDAVRLF